MINIYYKTVAPYYNELFNIKNSHVAVKNVSLQTADIYHCYYGWVNERINNWNRSDFKQTFR